jgi:bile acid-coenzyme A ligase
VSDDTPLGVKIGRLAVADPDRPALTCGSDTRSRAELQARTNRLARAYANLGVTRDSFVTIGLPNGIEFFEATVAAWKLGATPQPISSRLPAIERSAIIDLADSSLVVGVDPAEAPGRAAVPIGFQPDRALSSDPLPAVIGASFKAPTSGGSTGRPKLIVATQPGTWEALAGFAALLRVPDDGVHLVSGPLYHNGPFTTALLALLSGNHIVVMPRFDAASALALIERHRVDWMYAVPTMMHRIWRLPEAERTRHDVSSLKVVFHMAAPCPMWLKEAWIGWLGPDRVLELYGGTEADTFVFKSLTDTGITSSSRDLIVDFSHGVDRIDLSAIDARSNVSGNDAFRFIETGSFSGKSGELHYVSRTLAGVSSTIIEGDVNGDRLADFQIELSGRHALAASDFVL